MSSIEEEDREINPNSLHYILGKLTADVETLKIGVARLDTRMWGLMLLVVIGIGLQILFQVMP